MKPEEYNIRLKEVEKIVDDADSVLMAVIGDQRSPSGLVSDSVKKTDAYKQAKANYQRAFYTMQRFCKSVPNKVKREAMEIRRWGK